MEQPVDAAVYQKTIYFFEQLLQMLHPFMPFVTEEIYHRVQEQNDDLCVKQFGEISPVVTSLAAQGELLKMAISTVRDVRIKNNIKPKETIKIYIQSSGKKFELIQAILKKQTNADEIGFVDDAVPDSIATLVGSTTFYIKAEQKIDTDIQRKGLQTELDYQKEFLGLVEKKLGNERFVQNAKPEVVDMEKKKQADAEARIKTLEESLANLN